MSINKSIVDVGMIFVYVQNSTHLIRTIALLEN